MKKLLTMAVCGVSILGLAACSNTQEAGSISLGQDSENYIDEGIIGITNEQLFETLTEIHPELGLDTMKIDKYVDEQGYVEYYASPTENVMISFTEVENLDKPKYESSIGSLYQMLILYEKETESQEYILKLIDGLNQITVKELMNDKILSHGEGLDEPMIDYYKYTKEEVQELWSEEDEYSKKITEELEKAGINGSQPVYEISIG